jgi:hypothetical protein
MNNEVAIITSEIIALNFDLQLPENEDEKLFALMRERLIDRLNYLLDHDFEKLLWILYRIDVDEQLVKTTLANSPGKPATELLADLIIQRQIKKAETRIKYRSGEL